MRWVRHGMIAVLLVFSSATHLNAAVRAAILQTDPQQTGDLVALVEARLAATGKVKLVERQQIGTILREQQLSAVLGAEAVAGRVSLGKLLQADLLIFIQPQPGPPPRIGVVISETHHGLRLIRESFAESKTEDKAAALDKLIDDAIEKQSEKSYELFAVPPFACNDLGFSYAYLKGAYAKVIEGGLLRQKGVLVVELAEAQAVAKEIALTSGNDVERPLPLYVLGEYRTDSADKVTKVKITLKLMRGSQEIAGGTKEGISIDQAPMVLQQATTWFLKKSSLGASAAPDSKAEAAALAERAHLLLSLGSWQESLDLAEASLLLNPSQVAVHRDALSALIEVNGPGPNVPIVNLPPGRRPAGASPNDRLRRGLEHLEPYFRGTVIDHTRDWRLVQGIISGLDGRLAFFWPNDPRLPPTDEERERLKLRSAAQEMILRVLEDKSRRKIVDETTLFLCEFEQLGGLSDDQLLAINFKVLSEFTYLPKEGAVFQSLDLHNPLDPADLEYDRKVGQLPNVDLHKRVDLQMQIVAAIRRKDAEKPQPPQVVVAPKAPRPTAGDDARLIKLSLKSDGTAGDDAWLPVEGWMPAGRGIDVVWSSNGIFVMKQPGVLRQIDDRVPKSSVPYYWAHPAFDGKYVWFTRASYVTRSYVLLAVDPQRETVLQIDHDDGLPVSQSLQVAAISPGRAVVVGNFGQTYAAIVSLTPETKPTRGTVKILHEFRRVPVVGDKEQWRDADLIFTPWSLRIVNEKAADGSSRQAALVWRQSDEPAVWRHLISIDLTSGEVHAIEQETNTQSPELIAAAGGDCWEVGFGRQGWELSRFGHSSVTTQAIGAEPDSRGRTQLFEYDGALHLMNDRGGWMIRAMDKGSFHKIKVAVPQTFSGLTVRRSEHYGLVGWFYNFSDIEANPTHGNNLDRTVYRIEFAKPVRELLGGTKSP